MTLDERRVKDPHKCLPSCFASVQYLTVIIIAFVLKTTQGEGSNHMGCRESLVNVLLEKKKEKYEYGLVSTKLLCIDIRAENSPRQFEGLDGS